MLQDNYEWYEAVNNTELDFVVSDNPAHAIRMGFNDICVPITSRKAIILRVKDKAAPIISKDMPTDGIINLSLKSVIAYNKLEMDIEAVQKIYDIVTSHATEPDAEKILEMLQSSGADD